MVPTRDRGYRMRDTEGGTLVAAGSFRVVFERDLCGGLYRGDGERMASDVKSLCAQGLLERRTIAADDRGRSLGVLAHDRQIGSAVSTAGEVARNADSDRVALGAWLIADRSRAIAAVQHVSMT